MKDKCSQKTPKVPYPYQIAAFNMAWERNVVLCLPTGSGKTFIAIMVIKKFADQLNRPFSMGGKRAFFLVPNKVLVNQQANAIKFSTPFTVGRFSGDSRDDFGAQIDNWTKTYWTNLFEKYQVFVMTRKIFADILNSGYISTSSIATIVFDEAHRGAPNAKGKRTSDDYVAIMDVLKKKGHSGIRIIGLTASLINIRWACDDKMNQMISIIENIYDSKVYFPECARGTKAKEIIWCYRELEGWDREFLTIPKALNNLASQISTKHCATKDENAIENVPITILLENDAIPITPKQIETTFKELARISLELGPWSLHQSLKLILKSYDVVLSQIGHLKSSFIEIIEQVVSILRGLEKSVSENLSKHKEKDLIAGIPNKMLRLLQLLYVFNEKPASKPLSAIIFVERRLDAFALSKWLNAISRTFPEYSFMKTAFAIGSSTYAPFPFNSCVRSKQSQVIEDFRNQKLNIVVSTSVLEEGLDITHCNLIIRYDEIKTLRAYVQSKGRARSKEAYFVFFALEKKLMEVNNDLKLFHLMEQQLHNYQRPINSSEVLPVNSESYLETSGGAVLPYSEVKNRVIFYCDHLPADNFTKKSPKCQIEKVKCDSVNQPQLYQCHLKLPKISPLHHMTFTGKQCLTAREAEMDAYYQTIQILRAHEELDDSFRPLASSKVLEKLLAKYNLNTDRSELKEWKKQIEIVKKTWIEENEKNDGKKRVAPELPPKPGTNKKRRRYSQVWSNVLKGYESMDSPCWFYKVNITIVTNGQPSLNFGTLGLITFHLLPLNELNDKLFIYSTKNKYKISLELLQNFVLKRSELEDITNFQEYIFTGCLKIGLDSDGINSKIFFTDSVAPFHMLFTFLTEENTIDFDMLKKIGKKRKIETSDYPKLTGALISKNYSDNTKSLFYVEKVDYESSPKSPFPCPEYATYEDYYKTKYLIKSLNGNQPLLICYSSPTKIYYPSQPNKIKSKDLKPVKMFNLIPELCRIEYFSGNFLSIVYTIPAITTSINQQLVAIQIRKRLCSEIGYGVSEIPANVKVFWGHERFTNFVPLRINNNNYFSQSAKPVDLSFVNIIPYKTSNSLESKKLSASKLSLDELPFADEIESDLSDENNSDYSESVGNDFDEQDDDFEEPKSFNPEVAEEENAVPVQDSRPDLEIFTSDKATLFNTNPPPVLKPVSWTDRNIKISTDLKTLNVELVGSKFISSKKAHDYEIDEIVNESNQLNDFSQENAQIISSNSIYQDHSSIYKYGLPTELIIEAMTTKKSNSFINLERLEIIGDSFLKYKVSAFLFLKLHELNEAKITYLKMHLIANYNLLQLGRAKGLAQLLNDREFRPRENWLPPFYSSQHREFTEQKISDKSVADMVEALIGAHLTCLGEDAALDFLCWLGMPLRSLKSEEACSSSTEDDKRLPLYNDIQPVENQLEIDAIWMCSITSKLENKLQYVFKRKDLLIEALTHPSWSRSHLNSYQRLEFLGDAILDYLITAYIYDHPNYRHLSPGEVTLIRQALVNNDYFATLSLVNGFHKFIFNESSTLFSAIVDFNNQLVSNDLLTGNKIKLGSFLLESLDNLDNVLEPPKALGDIFESIAGAIYLDSGNSLATVWRVYSRFLGNELEFFCANVPKSPTVRLFEKFPNSKFITEKMSDHNLKRKRLNLIVKESSFTINEEKLIQDKMSKHKERHCLVLSALNTLAKDQNSLINKL